VLLPKLIQPQLLPQLAGQLAVAEDPRPPQFQPTQLYLYAVHRIDWYLPVLREQTHARVALLLLVEDIQRLPPCGLLLVIDLAQIQNRPPYGSIARQAAILHDAEVAVILGVLLPVCPQERRKLQNARLPAA